MDRIRTLLLARTRVVVMDPDVIASAATRPSRDSDVEKLEDELAQLGYVMSLDLAATLRRLPQQAMQGLREWIAATLAGPQRPEVPLAAYAPTGDPPSAFARRMLSWLATSAEQPCPWCGELRDVGALDPCGHLVCRACWDGTGFTGCPVCARRVTLGAPFIEVPAGIERVRRHSGTLTLVHLGFDLLGATRHRFEQLLAQTRPLIPDDHAELDAIIDDVGPKAATWLPREIPRREAMAAVLARLWLVAPDRAAIVSETRSHIHDATDLLRIAVVLVSQETSLQPAKLRSIPRGLRRALLGVLEQLPLEQALEDMMRHRALWKRLGERLHPFEHATQMPNVALAFAAVRRTNLGEVALGPALRDRAVRLPFVFVEDGFIKPIRWAGPIEDALRAGNPRSALVRLTHRPDELLRRADHLVRLAQTRQVEALQLLLKAVELAATKGAPGLMLAVASHVARRARPWRRRVFFAGGDRTRAFGVVDRRTPLRGDAIAVMVGAIRRQLCNRAEGRKQFARAVIDRALVDLVLWPHGRPSVRAKVAWPRGSEIALPDGQEMRLMLHWQDSGAQRSDLRMSAVLFDRQWQHIETRQAVLDGTTSHVDLHLEQLQMAGARQVVVALTGARVAAERIPQCYVGVALKPEAGPLDPSALSPRFDLHGRALIHIPLSIDISERRVRWIDVRVRDKRPIERAGSYRAVLAHAARDVSEVIAVQGRPTLWDVACVHAAARANVVYIRERDGTFTTYRRRDNESKTARMGRLMSGAADDGRVTGLPASDAPMWFALVTPMPLPRGSVGYLLDARGVTPDGIELMTSADLVAELAVRQREDSRIP